MTTWTTRRRFRAQVYFNRLSEAIDRDCHPVRFVDIKDILPLVTKLLELKRPEPDESA